MSWPAIATVRGWMSKRKALLTGLVGVAVEEVVDLVPGGKLALRLVGEVAKHGVERLVDTKADVPDIKPAGQALPPAQLDEINAWLETLTVSYAGLLDQMEKLTAPTGNEPVVELTALVKSTLAGRDDLLRQFDASAQQVRRMTLSLSRVEEKLDVFFHGQQRIGLCLEDIKEVLVSSPLPGEWAEFRKARPEAVQALNRADEHFLAGRRDEGARELLGLLRQRGVGDETVCRALGIAALARGQLREANGYLARSAGGKQTMAPGLIATLTALGTAATRGPRLPVWRSLPRGLVVDRRYRVEAEVGRGGMASVYRAVGVIELLNIGQAVALKVPAADLLADPAARARFVTEIQVAQKLSGKHPAIVETFGYTVFDDPHSGRELFGLVMEFIDGPTLAHFLAQRQAKNRPLDPKEILHVLKPVCEGLEYAHAQGVYHRDVKPQNVLLTRKSQVKLADFGIARVLEDARVTVMGADVGTLAYMPPDRDFDARSDVYLLGNLLLELLTFDPRGDVEARADCPPEWADLVADAMNRLKGKRPQTVREFLARLEGRKAAPPPPPPPPPPPGPDRLRELIDAERFQEAMDEYRRLPHERRPLALLKELQDRWSARNHDLARDAAQTDYDYAAAVTLIEQLPETLRDGGILADYRTKRDRLKELRQGIHEDAEKRRYTFGLRARVAEYRGLKPDDADINDLHKMLGDIPKEIVVKSLGLKLVYVSHGTFWMGDRGSQRRVEVPHEFYLGAFPVTQGQWQEVMGSNPSYFTRGGGGADKVKGISDADLKQFPVEQVSWEDVQQFLERLNAREKGGGLLYRLPTEAEWEYSCRGGAFSSQKECDFDFYFGDPARNLSQPTNDLTSSQANFGNALQRTSKVGSYKPNRLGIYDLHGNVWEWCEDHFEAAGSARVIRGGSWFIDAARGRASNRFSNEPANRSADLGFRLAAVPSGE